MAGGDLDRPPEAVLPGGRWPEPLRRLDGAVDRCRPAARAVAGGDLDRPPEAVLPGGRWPEPLR
ncbi:hypothetical protein JNW87_37425, partial [Micromonospora sp. ATA51]|nr:hypothetical protein [Micromonospora sp. ATA51]